MISAIEDHEPDKQTSHDLQKEIRWMKSISVKLELNGVKVHRITNDGPHSAEKNIKESVPVSECKI